jgi:Transglycosylase SLT domain
MEASQEAAFVLGFAELSKQLGEIMGAPLENERLAHDEAIVQLTTTGLAVWRHGQLPKFTNGAEVYTLRPPIAQPAVSSRLERVADCIITRESQWNPNAVNPRSKASGLGQFLASTWRTTPQGKAGYSVFNPQANRAAVIWMLQVGRGKEFVTIGGC